MNYTTLEFISFLIILCTSWICHGSETGNFPDVCINVRNQFAKAASQFTLCSINNSRPITLCEDCIDSYLDVLSSYKNMSKVAVNETTCLDYFVNLDRLQIVATQYMNSVDLWSRGKCDECYESEAETGTNQTSNMSNKTKTFLSYYNSFQGCVNITDADELCEYCMEYYVVLHDYFMSISNSNDRISLCIDLVDLMNTTWTFWSDNCCKYRRHNEYIFIGCTIMVFFLTILFYVVNQFCAEKRIPTIIQQTRFAESINSLRS